MMKQLPTLIPPASLAKPAGKGIRFSPVLAEVTSLERDAVFSRMKTGQEGLGEDEAARRLAEVGPNVVAEGKHRGWPWRLLAATRNPLVILLVVLATISLAFFFSIAVAVGLTPEMLPMIVSVCLSKGALAMSRKKVIVKQLSAIQNFGTMDVLCTDKTGTLTMDRVILRPAGSSNRSSRKR